MDDSYPAQFLRSFESFERGLMPFLLSLVPPSLHAHVATVTVQQVLAAAKASGQHEWVVEFERKYGLK